MPGRYL